MSKPILTARLLAVMAAGLACTASAAELNTLSAGEQRDGWVLLFDGQSTRGWHNFKQPGKVGEGWKVQDGCLHKQAKVNGGDLLSDREFDNFELAWEWRIPARANNGVKYFVLETRSAALGHEYQMIDNATIGSPKQRTASFYDVLPPGTNTPPVRLNDWNQSRILVAGNHVEHWLNGVKVLEYECGSPAVRAGVARSKFKDIPGFGEKQRGRIMLTDHNDETWFRNVKVRVPGAVK